MQLTPNEIESVEDAGMLDSSPVKLIRTRGGFWIAVGRPKGKPTEEALSAGSHPAIVKYNLEKQFPGFQPTMMKSEMGDQYQVEKHSHFLSDDLRKSGYDIFSIQNGPDIEFQITKHNAKLTSVSANLENDTLVIKEMKVDPKFARGLAGAASEKAVDCGSRKIRLPKV